MSELLIIIDFQKDFVTGTLGFTHAESLEERIFSKVNNALSQKKHVYFTMDTHFDDYLSTMEGRQLPIPHCIYNTEGWHLYGKLSQFEESSNPFVHKVMKKTFGSSALPFLIQNGIKNIEKIEICGIVTNICVISNAILLKTFLPETEIFIDASCCGSFDPQLHEKALDIMSGLGMNIIRK